MSKNHTQCDVLIAGAGIIGLTLAHKIKQEHPNFNIRIVEKEKDVAYHGSGRNSGVLHAGFYYSANSLKAKLTRDGNAAWKKYVREHGLSMNENQKIVVASDESEIDGIKELFRRGQVNGVDVSIIDEKQVRDVDPNVKTTQIALYSPTTATVDPVECSRHLRANLERQGVQFQFDNGFLKKQSEHSSVLQDGTICEHKMFINAAGLYADVIAKQYGYSQNYTIVPFKGIYLKYTGATPPLRTNVYPVPNLNNPFLGVHFTITVDGTVKIGPTAIPAFWRENYGGFSRFKAGEFLSILSSEAELFIKNKFNFRALAFEEMKKYNKRHFVDLAAKMVHQLDREGFNQWSKPGIRAQLLNTETLELVQDFVVEGDSNSVHVLNAVSPAFTSSFPFSDWIYQTFLKGKL